MVEIKDGKGRGFSASVNYDNHLRTLSVVESKINYASSVKQSSFCVSTTETADTLTKTATGGVMLMFKNNSPSYNANIEKIFVSTDTAGIGFKVNRNPIESTFGNNTSVNPLNLSFGSALEYNVSCNIWDEVGDGITGLSGGNYLFSVVCSAGINIFPLDNSIIITNGSIISIETFGSVTGEISVSMEYYMNIVDGD